MGRPSNEELMKRTKAQEELLETQNEELKKEQSRNEELSNKLETQMNEMNELKEMMKAMMNGMGNMNSQSYVSSNSEEEVFIGTNHFKDLYIYLDGKEFILNGCDEPVPFTKEEVRLLTKHPKYKELMIDGWIYFENKDKYDEFRIYPVIDFSDEGLIEFLNKPKAELVKELKDVQLKVKRKFRATWALTFKIAELLRKGKFNDFEKINAVEDFLKVDISKTARKQLEYMMNQNYYSK